MARLSSNRQDAKRHTISIDHLLDGDDLAGNNENESSYLSDNGTNDPSTILGSKTTASILDYAIRKLPKQQAEIIRKRFWEGMSQERIAKSIGTNKMAICRIEKKAILKLRELLAGRLNSSDVTGVICK